MSVLTRCSVCRDTRKLIVEGELYWCEFCCPASVAGSATTEDAELPTAEPKKKKGKVSFSDMLGDYIEPANDAGFTHMTFSNSTFTVASAPAPPPLDPANNPILADGNPDPTYCVSCGSHSTYLVHTVRTRKFHDVSVDFENEDPESEAWWLEAESSAFNEEELEHIQYEIKCASCHHYEPLPGYVEINFY